MGAAVGRWSFVVVVFVAPWSIPEGKRDSRKLQQYCVLATCCLWNRGCIVSFSLSALVILRSFYVGSVTVLILMHLLWLIGR